MGDSLINPLAYCLVGDSMDLGLVLYKELMGEGCKVSLNIFQDIQIISVFDESPFRVDVEIYIGGRYNGLGIPFEIDANYVTIRWLDGSARLEFYDINCDMGWFDRVVGRYGTFRLRT